MVRRISIALAITVLLAACGPKLEAERIAGRTIMITNGGDEPVTVSRIVANDDGERAECVDQPATTLGPGRSYTTTFMLCEEVAEVDIETDQGSREVGFSEN